MPWILTQSLESGTGAWLEMAYQVSFDMRELFIGQVACAIYIALMRVLWCHVFVRCLSSSVFSLFLRFVMLRVSLFFVVVTFVVFSVSSPWEVFAWRVPTVYTIGCTRLKT